MKVKLPNFYLRSLLILMLLACVGLGWAAKIHHSAQRQRQIVASLVARNIHVSYDFQLTEDGFPGGTGRPRFERVANWLGKDYTSDVRGVFSSQYHSQPIDNDVIVEIGELRALRTLTISKLGQNVTDWSPLNQLTQLRKFDVFDAPLRDSDLLFLESNRNLRFLDLANTLVTDDGLAHLSGLEQLQTLDLTGTQITDDGLKHLESLHQLVFLMSDRTKLTKTGIDRLEKRLPNCSVSGPYPASTDALDK